MRRLIIFFIVVAVIAGLGSSMSGGSQAASSGTSYLYLKVGGIIAIAAGCGLAGLSWFVAQVLPRAMYPLLGAGVLVVAVQKMHHARSDLIAQGKW